MLEAILGLFGGTDLTGAVTGLGATIGGFMAAVMDVTMWRSLGWLWLGMILMLWGVTLWRLGGVKGATNLATSAVTKGLV